MSINFLDSTSISTDKTARNRQITYLATAFGLIILYWGLRDSNWHGSVALHTSMELVATTLALFVGSSALKHYHSSNSNMILLIVGAGFIGTGLLDGYHMVVTSAWVKDTLPSGLESLIPWSWIASRLFLAVMMVLSLAAWYRSKALVDSHGISPALVYISTLAMTLLCGLYFAFIPLPRAYYPELFAHRPEEFVPGILFIAALYGFLKKGNWRDDIFEHWLVLCIIVNVIAQWVFMPYSNGLFDMQFDFAHVLKKIAYICALTGLLIAIKNHKKPAASNNTIKNKNNGSTSSTLAETLNPGIVGKRLLFLIGFLGMFIIVSMIASQQVNQSRDATQSLLKSLDGIAETKKTAVTEKLKDYKMILRMISSMQNLRLMQANNLDPEISKDQYQENNKVIESILNDVLASESLIYNISVHDLSGNEVASAGELWTAEVEAESIVIPETQIVHDMRNIYDTNIIQITGPLKYQDKLIGGIQLWIGSQPMSAILDGVHTLGKTADALLAFRNNAGHIILLRPPRELPEYDKRSQNTDLTRSNYPMLRAIDGEEGVFDTGLVDYMGEPVFAALRFLPEANLGLIVKISKAEVESRLIYSLKNSLLLGSIVLAFALLLGWLSSYLLISPLHRITQFAHNFSNEINRAGNNKKLQINTTDEFGVLANTLMQAAEDIHNRELALSSIKKRMHAVLENMQDVVFIINTGGIIQYCNNSTESTLGYSPHELINQNINILISKERHKKHNSYLRNHMNSDEDNFMGNDREVKALHKNGNEIPVNITISRIEIGNEILFSGILHDNTQSKAYENALEIQNRELSAANEELEQFAYVASHDLKTPLRAIDNLVEWVIDDMQDMTLPPEVEHNLKRLQERSSFMDKMISELLSFSRAGRYTYPAETVNVKKLVSQIVYDLAPPEGIRVIIDNGLPELKTPKPPLEMVLRNLISNAIKHHDRDEGNIHVTAVCDDEKCLFCVTDDGPGIEKQYHKKVFQIFQTLLPKSKTGSTGMGLALVKRVVEGYGHTIHLLSETGKRGCQIEFGWPKNWQEKNTKAAEDSDSTLNQDAA